MKRMKNSFIYLLTAIMIFTFISWSDCFVVEAASYPSIMLNDVPYFPQKLSGDCGISSIAMIEAYALGYDSSCFEALYDGVYAANGSLSIGKAVNNGKYVDISKDLETVYNQLKAGKPVLIYRGDASNHWSVIVGYNGSSASLQKSGFIVYNTAHGTTVGVPYKSNLSEWLSGNSWLHAKVRNTGAINEITTRVSTLTLENVCYPSNLKSGSGMGSRGLLISSGTITQVTLGVKNSSGKVMFSGSATPNSKYYTLLNLDSKMKFGSLSAGTYTYYITVSDSTGATISWEKKFTVSSSATALKTTTVTGSGEGTTQSSIYTDAYVENVTETNAVMNASFDTIRYITTAGVYFGTNVNNLHKITENANCNAKKIYYDASKWIGTLHPGTTYYYQLYATVNGVEHKTDVYSFTTLDQTKPVINAAEIVSITGSYYTVRCKASDNGYIEKVSFPTWTTANGQDDLVDNWRNNTAVYSADSNGYYTYTVNVSAHNNESGEYNTHVYVFDTAGNYVLQTLLCEVYPLKGISLSKSSIQLNKGASTTLSVNYNPANTTEFKTVSWKSSNTSIATVSTTGKVTAVGTGQAIITATVAGKTATCIVTVKDNAASGINSPVKAFVERMYTEALGRTSDVEGVTYWTNMLLSYESDGAGISQGFILGSEFKNRNYSNEKYIQILYRTFMNRDPESGGLTYWLNNLASGKSREYVLSGFVNSDEFYGICTTYGISKGYLRENGCGINPGIFRFSKRLYTMVLEREGERTGIEYWALRIANEQSTPEAAAQDFFQSNEYLSKQTTDEKYIQALYLTFMNREAEANGMNYWKNVLGSGASREYVLSQFANSNEFKEIMRGFGL